MICFLWKAKPLPRHEKSPLFAPAGKFNVIYDGVNEEFNAVQAEERKWLDLMTVQLLLQKVAHGQNTTLMLKGKKLKK